jgi:hypothetical protein
MVNVVVDAILAVPIKDTVYVLDVPTPPAPPADVVPAAPTAPAPPPPPPP